MYIISSFAPIFRAIEMRKIFIILLLGAAVFSAKAQYLEGTHYDIVSETATKGSTVTEYFSFYCGHCFQFESMLDEYKKGLNQGTKFEKSHVDYIPRDNPPVQLGIVKAYLVIQAIGMDEKLRPAFFKHIHTDGKPIDTEKDIEAVFTSNGVSSADFKKHYNDPKLVSAAKAMVQDWKDKGISNVPTMVVNGKYRLNMQSIGTLEDLIALTNFLIEKAKISK